MTVVEGGGIFVSYRRQESSHFAGRLYDRLADRFGEGRVFMDVDTIEPGVDFAEEIFRAVASCAVLLAVISPGWLSAADERGRRRLDDPDDIVRLEIEAALARGVRVIPIMVEGAVLPGREDLPESLAGLTRRHALSVRHESFRYDAGRLVAAIERILDALAPSAPAAPSVSGSDGARPADDVPRKAAHRTAGPSRNRRARLADLDRAERIARSITDESRQAGALSAVAKALADSDPGRSARLFAEAEHVASLITDGSRQAGALSAVAKALADSDPGRSARLFAEAERIASSKGTNRVAALSAVAEAVSVSDPDRAERVANSIPDRQRASSRVAEALATTDPDRAERIARSINHEFPKASVLSAVAEALAATDPDRAERTARSINHESTKASALSRVARALSESDPGRAARLVAEAERTARSITDGFTKASTLSAVAKALADIAPGRAAQVFSDAERTARSIPDKSSKEALTAVAEAIAASDPDWAERIAFSMPMEHLKASVLSAVAEALATADPDRAERIARSITDKYWKANALSRIAGTLAVASS